MTAVKWKPFPHNAKDYAYQGAALKSASPELHRGDCEPFPDAAFIKQAFARHRRLKGARRRKGGGGPAIGLAGLSSRRFWRGGRGRDGARADRRQCSQQGRQARDSSGLRQARRGPPGGRARFPERAHEALEPLLAAASGQLRPLHLTSEIEVRIVAPVDAGRRILDLLTIAPIAHDPVSDLLLDVVEPDRSL